MIGEGDETMEKKKQLDKASVLWTARTGDDLQKAIDLCKAKGLIFDEVAKDKPNADFFIDDKAATIEALRG